MLLIKAIFWMSLCMVIYTYVGYGLIISFLNFIRRSFYPKSIQRPRNFQPEVSLIIAAYNEADCLERKIKNCLELDYPENKLEILFITDGSTDNSTDIIRRYPRVRLLHQPERKGKSAALNRAVKHIRTPYVIFCDANTVLHANTIKKIMPHYSDPKVGGVAGEKRLLIDEDDGIAGQGEGFYWKYESWLKRLDSDFHTVVGAAGELFSLRTELYEPIDEAVILDDFIISMRVALNGYRVIYEPEAYALESPSMNLYEEQKRKIRISAGGFQAIKMLRQAFNIFKHPLLSFQFVSHRIFRWTIAPVCLLLLWVLNGIIIINDSNVWYDIFFCMQVFFYLFAWFGYFLTTQKYAFKIFQIPYYFVFMNIAVFLGFFRFYKGTQSAVWDKAKRQVDSGFKNSDIL